MLRAGDGEYDRLKIMMENGDPGAAITWADEMHFAGDTAEKDRALRIAAEAGSFIAMSDLGWSLINRLEAERPEGGLAEAEYWLERAATLGDASAAGRLGACYAHAFYFCAARDAAEAARWYEIALGPIIHYSLPRITVDANGAIRLGTMAKWYSEPYGVQESAAYELAKLVMEGDGVPRDRERAVQLLTQAGKHGDAAALLERMRQEPELGAEPAPTPPQP